MYFVDGERPSLAFQNLFNLECNPLISPKLKLPFTCLSANTCSCNKFSDFAKLLYESSPSVTRTFASLNLPFNSFNSFLY